VAAEQKLADTLAYPPRYMRADRMAAYCSVSKSKFLEWVDEGIMPQSIPGLGGVTLFDRIEIEAAFEDLKDKAAGAIPVNSVHKILGIH
jgi:predicted DNA-binding transcriptional regulator AlpA